MPKGQMILHGSRASKVRGPLRIPLLLIQFPIPAPGITLTPLPSASFETRLPIRSPRRLYGKTSEEIQEAFLPSLSLLVATPAPSPACSPWGIFCLKVPFRGRRLQLSGTLCAGAAGGRATPANPGVAPPPPAERGPGGRVPGLPPPSRPGTGGRQGAPDTHGHLRGSGERGVCVPGTCENVQGRHRKGGERPRAGGWVEMKRGGERGH